VNLKTRFFKAGWLILPYQKLTNPPKIIIIIIITAVGQFAHMFLL